MIDLVTIGFLLVVVIIVIALVGDAICDFLAGDK